MIGSEYDTDGMLKWRAFPSPTIKTFSENKNAKVQTSLHAFSFLPKFIQKFAYRVKWNKNSVKMHSIFWGNFNLSFGHMQVAVMAMVNIVLRLSFFIYLILNLQTTLKKLSEVIILGKLNLILTCWKCYWNAVKYWLKVTCKYEHWKTFIATGKSISSQIISTQWYNITFSVKVFHQVVMSLS